MNYGTTVSAQQVSVVGNSRTTIIVVNNVSRLLLRFSFNCHGSPAELTLLSQSTGEETEV